MRKRPTLDLWFKPEEEEKKKEETAEETKEAVDESSQEQELEEIEKESLLTKMVKEFLRKIRIPELKTIHSERFNIIELLRKYNGALLVTEKQKVAKAFSAIFPRSRSIKIGKITVYEANWNGYPIYIVPLKGHITEIVPIKEFSGRWEKSDPLKLIDPSALREKIKEKEIAELIKRYARRVKLLLIATDADEEGSNIGLEAYKISKEVNPNIRAYRLWFISVQRQELINAFQNPILPKWSWAWAVQARRLVDAMVGFSATRELTIALRDLVHTLKVRAFSIGRVQTPTLYLIYLREKEIKEFKPKPYWTFNIKSVVNGLELTFQPINAPYFDYEKARREYEIVKNSGKIVIKDVKKEYRKILPPLPLDTTAALTMINDILGVSSKKAMDVLEELYLNGLITYPRTETNKYPANYNHARNLTIIAKHPKFGVIARDILKRGVRLRRNGTRFVGDHLPITPIDIALPGDRRLPTKLHADIYELILRRYLALFLDPAEIEKITIIGLSGSVLLKTTENFLKKDGFLTAYPYADISVERKRIELNIGTQLKITISNLEKKFTKPPNRLSESQLIKLMERLGLGTKSTRPEHIETLVSRRYIKRSGKKLVMTDLGFALMEQLEKIWPDFLKPYFSAKVHILMRKVMNEEIDWRKMVELVKEDFLKLFLKLRDSIEHMGKALRDASKDLIEKEFLIECPKCKTGKMILIPLKKKKVNLLRCTNCGHTLIIPKATKYQKTTAKCKLCGTTILVLQRKDSLAVFCPSCWREIGPCTKCPHLYSCQALQVVEKYLSVGKCSCGEGMLLFIKKYNMVRCNSCEERYYLPKEAKNVRLLNEKCPTCGLRVFSFTLPGKKRRLKYCVKCKKYL